MTLAPDNEPAKSTTPTPADTDATNFGDGSQTAGDVSQQTTPSRPSISTLQSASSVTSLHSNTALDGSLHSPGGSRLPTRVSSPYPTVSQTGPAALIAHAFVPHVSVLSSSDCEELIRHKGLNGGFLELIRPFADTISARVVIRDSTGAGRAWDDFGVRFVGIKDGLDPPRPSGSRDNSADEARRVSEEYRPARLRSGGDSGQIEQLVERWLDSSNEPNKLGLEAGLPASPSPFAFYERKLLSGTVLTPQETFAHPVALVIAISSRNQSPIEELRNLYAESNTGVSRLPPWVNNEYLRYYVLVHDEDYDDIKQSTALYEQMKRHFGLHCHLLRIRSTPCPEDADDGTILPTKVWTSAAEDLQDLADREDDSKDSTPPRIYESDAVAVRSFVREMVTQSIIPAMERSVATWNDQVASRRRGFSGRFMSLSKRFTPFGSRSNSPATASGSNYDSSTGIYRTDAPEALMRKLADYAVMLRDYKLAHTIYELLCGDFKSDKAWRHYAGANEMAAITLLLTSSSNSVKVRLESIDTWLENAYYSYFTRCNVPFNATRTIILGASFLQAREGPALDAAARWLIRLLDDRIVGPVAHALVLERIGECFAARQGQGALCYGARRRRAAFWTTLAARAWLDMEKPGPAAGCLERALQLYDFSDGGGGFEGIRVYLAELDGAVQNVPLGARETDKVDVQSAELVDQRPHRASLSLSTTFDPLGAVQLPSSALPERREAADGFE